MSPRIPSAAHRRKERKTPITVPEVLTSAALAFVISIVLFNLSEMLQEYLDAYPVPNQMAVRNIAVALKTILQGGSYLLSFMFAANAAGLFLMGGRMVIDPVFERDVNAGVKVRATRCSPLGFRLSWL